MLTWSRKTTVAVEYCYRRSRAYPSPHIFWIHGNSDQAFKASYLEIAQRASLRGDDDDTWLRGVRLWLESMASGNWIMVIDNLDDLDLIIMRYIPARRGTILFTTRDARIIGHPRYLPFEAGVEIREINDQEAFETFSRLLGAAGAAADRETSKLLLDRLEKLPLAITQAAAYIRETRISLDKYLELLQECEQNQREFLGQALPNALAIESESSTPRAAIMTWKITMDRIQRESPLSFKLLQLMSFLDPEKIPEELMKSAWFLENESTVQFSKALALLLNFALLYPLGSSNYRLHRLVSFCIRAQVDLEGPEGEEHLMSAVGLVYYRMPVTPIDDYSKCIQYLPHAIAALEHTGCKNLEVELRWDLESCVGCVLVTMADYVTAMEWYQRALDGYEKTLGKDHPSTINTVNNMGLAFCNQGEYGKAIEWYQRSLDGYEKTLGMDHPSTLDTVNHIGSVFDNCGEFDKALEWYNRALDGYEKTLGKDHPSTLETVNHMGSVFDNCGEFDKALEWYNRALDGYEKTLGKDHPSTLETVNHMGSVFDNCGEFDKALEWYNRALDGYEKTLGKDHPSTLETINNMGSVFKHQGEYGKALEWYQRSLNGKEKTLGMDHPSTLDIVNNMGSAFYNQGEYGKAVELYQRSLDGCEKTLGKDHPSTLETINNMGLALYNQGEYGKAIEWYQRSLDGCEKTLGKDHPFTLDIVNNMGSAFYNQGEYGKAVELYQRSLDGYEKTLGKDHPSTIKTVNDMGIVFDKQGYYGKALEWYQRALDGRQKTLGEDHPLTLRTTSNIASVRDRENVSQEDLLTVCHDVVK
jgi:tetratricopeptide (TPR) repeat protein